ncbi:hypothetical protein [Streptomyces sp. TRM68367]|uniref:Rv1733c family protein n=1 Tax=Streptomyces sp. TRM68367 TaxID=2758415 RepID=UPI00165AB336|nr:hypothetical protein [Streptomyces sp. TRM68367]MBC9727778.1 hypothetical protein [Streptomyces sp. TRM68367]
MRTRVRGWRWRRSPLRRRSDVVEAWTVLAVAALLCVGAPLAGAVAAWWAHGEARAIATEQRAERHRVRAEVVRTTSVRLPSAQANDDRARQATVHWTEPGEGRRTATARVPAGARQGDVVDLWFDSRGRSVPPPVSGPEVWQHSVTLGAFAAGGVAALVLIGHRAVRRVALHHRLAEWEREWARTEPEWTHRGA